VEGLGAEDPRNSEKEWDGGIEGIPNGAQRGESDFPVHLETRMTEETEARERSQRDVQANPPAGRGVRTSISKAKQKNKRREERDIELRTGTWCGIAKKCNRAEQKSVSATKLTEYSRLVQTHCT